MYTYKFRHMYSVLGVQYQTMCMCSMLTGPLKCMLSTVNLVPFIWGKTEWVREGQGILSTHTYMHVPFNLLSVEYLDSYLVTGQLMFGQLHLTKASMTKCLTKNVPTHTKNGVRTAMLGGHAPQSIRTRTP